MLLVLCFVVLRRGRGLFARLQRAFEKSEKSGGEGGGYGGVS